MIFTLGSLISTGAWNNNEGGKTKAKTENGKKQTERERERKQTQLRTTVDLSHQKSLVNQREEFYGHEWNYTLTENILSHLHIHRKTFVGITIYRTYRTLFSALWIYWNLCLQSIYNYIHPARLACIPERSVYSYIYIYIGSLVNGTACCTTHNW